MIMFLVKSEKRMGPTTLKSGTPFETPLIQQENSQLTITHFNLSKFKRIIQFKKSYPQSHVNS